MQEVPDFVPKGVPPPLSPPSLPPPQLSVSPQKQGLLLLQSPHGPDHAVETWHLLLQFVLQVHVTLPLTMVGMQQTWPTPLHVSLLPFD
jgi:hypothetical protein